MTGEHVDKSSDMDASECWLPGWKAFQEAIEQELIAIRGLKQRVTVLLIEIDGDSRPEAHLVSSVCGCLSEATRKRDSVYRITDQRFAAILRGTHEAGGQTAALRIKRLISKRIAQEKGGPVTLSIGVSSVGPEDAADLKRINDSLEKDLILDRECQCFVLEQAGKGRDQRGTIVILSDISGQGEPLASMLSSKGHNVSVTGDPDTALAILEHNRESVLVVGPGVPLGLGASLCKKLRLNRELDSIVILWIHDGPEEDLNSFRLARLVDESLSPAVNVDCVASRISAALGISRLKRLSSDKRRLECILDSIGSASHQLNQPLQIILSKIEILLLNMEEDAPERKALAEVRKQALRAGSINQKVARLIKTDIS